MINANKYNNNKISRYFKKAIFQKVKLFKNRNNNIK